MEDKFLILRSKASKDLYPTNDAFDFKNQFAGRFRIRDDARVGLAEIRLQYSKAKSPKNVIVISDIADDTVIGETRLNLIKIVDLSQGRSAQELTDDYITIAFERPHFFPTSKSLTNSVTITLLDLETGKPISALFKPEEITNFKETFVTLQFR